MPKSSLPPDNRSSGAACSASSTGVCPGKTRTPVPRGRSRGRAPGQVKRFRLAENLPEPPKRGEARAFREAGELGPDDRRVDRGLADPGSIAAIAAGDDVVAADEIGIAGDAL